MNRRVYELTDRSGFAEAYPADDADEWVLHVGLRGWPAQWSAPSVVTDLRENRGLPVGDLVFLTDHTFLVRDEAVGAIRPWLEAGLGELLPVRHPRLKLWAFHGLKQVDALDYSRTRFSKHGTILGEPVLDPSLLQLPVFEMPSLAPGTLYFTDAALEFLRLASLTGLAFQEVWPSTSSPLEVLTCFDREDQSSSEPTAAETLPVVEVPEAGSIPKAIPIATAPDPWPQLVAASGRIESQMTGAGLTREVVSRVMERARASWVLLPEKRDHVRVGTTKVGGLPDLPPERAWPTWHGRPLAFLAQVNLSETQLPSSIPALDLPKVGLLSFFFDVQDLPGGYAPEHAGGGRVLYSNGSVARRGAPPGVEVYEECRVHRDVDWSLPLLSEVPDQERAPVPSAKHEAYEQVRVEHPRYARDIRLGGYPDQIQRDMQFEVAAATAGEDTGTEAGWDRAVARNVDTRPWRLLLQLPSNEESEMEWEDGGVLYFWIREDDLHGGHFGDVWTVLQSY